MNRIRKLVPIAGLVATLVVAAPVAFASEKASASAYKPARNAQGHPDLQGIWDFRTLTPLERPEEMGEQAVFSEEEQEAFRQKAIAVNDVDNKRTEDGKVDVEGAYNSAWYDFGTEMNEDRRTSLIVDPANGRLPALTSAAKVNLKENLKRVPPVRDLFSFSATPGPSGSFRPVGPEVLGLSERCMVGFNAGPPLTPSAYNNNLRIVQAPSHVVIFTEMIHDARIIPIDGRPHLSGDIKKWYGDSRGHWDGDTLVVETRNFTNKTPIYQLPLRLDKLDETGPVGFGQDMRLVERFTRVSDSRINYEYTIDAPDTFVKPFTVIIPMRATDDQIFEYACHEGNYGMAGMLGGARTAEKEDAAAAANQ